MLSRIFNHHITQALLVMLILTGAFICVFTPNYYIFTRGVNYAFQIMLGYLALGFLFLLIGQSKLMFTSFICCAGLCLFLKHNSNTVHAILDPNGKQISLAHFNISNSNNTKSQTIDQYLETDADIMSFQEVTPDWSEELNLCLRDKYPFRFSMPSAGILGMALYSKIPFDFIDTFHLNDLPHIIACLELGDEEVCMIGSHPYPAFDYQSYQDLLAHFDNLSAKIETIDSPVIIFGDYNTVGWGDEIQDFRQKTKLRDSRRGFMPSYPHGSLTFFEIPVDHIFYSRQFDCLDFKTISGPSTRHLGILGLYQLISDATIQ